MICPKCGESNPDNFRFCGLCGTVLHAAKAPGAPKAEPPKAADTPLALRIPANPPRASSPSERAPHAGPSLAGLGQSEPTPDALRERAFSGIEPRFLTVEPRRGHGRTVALLVILAVLGVGIWARYYYYGSETQTAQAPPTVAETKEASGAPAAEPTPPKPVAAEAPTAAPVQPAPAPAAEKPADQTPTTVPEKPAKQPPQAKPSPAATHRAATRARPSPAREARTKPVAVVKPAPAADTGDQAFRKGEAYLYGRGVAENCDEAIKNLKAASAKGSAKARSTFGTMYATGHCVSRDLPTSYSWFALALRADPNNQILEKDLSAIWNQMTPPERQLATKQKQ